MVNIRASAGSTSFGGHKLFNRFVTFSVIGFISCSNCAASVAPLAIKNPQLSLKKGAHMRLKLKEVVLCLVHLGYCGPEGTRLGGYSEGRKGKARLKGRTIQEREGTSLEATTL